MSNCGTSFRRNSPGRVRKNSRVDRVGVGSRRVDGTRGDGTSPVSGGKETHSVEGKRDPGVRGRRGRGQKSRDCAQREGLLSDGGSWSRTCYQSPGPRVYSGDVGGGVTGTGLWWCWGVRGVVTETEGETEEHRVQ